MSMCLQTPLSNVVYHLAHLAIIEVSGEDTIQFLQGQLTCNINDISESKASIAAFCNAKGRVISTLIVAKTPIGFWLILPESLAETVRKKLQMYVLRSKVTLCISEDLSLFGMSGTEVDPPIVLPDQSFDCLHRQNLTWIRLPSEQPRFLCIVNLNAGDPPFFNDAPDDSLGTWRYQDISSGFPWFDIAQSEHYIPQMLNIDQLGGISFNKGCYTGQEIVARTHYLGKSKRQLYLAECHVNLPTLAELTVLDAEKQTKCGDIVAMQGLDQNTRMLIVLQTIDDSLKTLILDNHDHTPINLIAFQ